MTLWRASTGESWNGLMHDCEEFSFNADGTHQSPLIAQMFWVIFQLFSFFVFMNVFIAVIYENFNDIH